MTSDPLRAKVDEIDDRYRDSGPLADALRAVLDLHPVVSIKGDDYCQGHRPALGVPQRDCAERRAIADALGVEEEP